MKKRALDLAVTILALILLSPLLLIVALAIKLDLPGPVFFRQERMGRGNRIFRILKFRSMRAETTDANGARSASRDDDRITRVGRFIRATSIDELRAADQRIVGRDEPRRAAPACAGFDRRERACSGASIGNIGTATRSSPELPASPRSAAFAARPIPGAIFWTGSNPIWNISTAGRCCAMFRSSRALRKCSCTATLIERRPLGGA